MRFHEIFQRTKHTRTHAVADELTFGGVFGEFFLDGMFDVDQFRFGLSDPIGNCAFQLVKVWRFMNV